MIKNWINHLLKNVRVSRAAHDVAPNVRTVCLLLGPYRNLTTLTASILFLHPRCQVLNHAGDNIFNNPNHDFLLDPSEARLNRFLGLALELSREGVMGNRGGSITASHAFRADHAMPQLYKESGLPMVKDRIESLVWKESLLVANHLRAHHVELKTLLEKLPRLRFLQPIRNPMDCAVSCMKEKYKLFQELPPSPSVEDVLGAILDEYAWMADAWQKRPDQFFVFYEHSFDSEMLRKLAGFLELEPDPRWIELALRAFDMKSRYDHPPARVDFFRAQVNARLSGHPEFARQLLRFISETESIP